MFLENKPLLVVIFLAVQTTECILASSYFLANIAVDGYIGQSFNGSSPFQSISNFLHKTTLENLDEHSKLTPNVCLSAISLLLTIKNVIK